MWEEVEDRKIDEARMAKAGRERRKERKEKTNNRRRKMIARLVEEKENEEEDLIELRGDRRNGSKKVPQIFEGV